MSAEPGRLMWHGQLCNGAGDVLEKGCICSHPFLLRHKFLRIVPHSQTVELCTFRPPLYRVCHQLQYGSDALSTLVEWATSIKYKIMNTIFQKKAGRTWTWKSPNGITKVEIDCILANRPDIVTDVTVISQVNVGSDHIIVTSNTKLDIAVERKTINDQDATKSRCLTNRIKN